MYIANKYTNDLRGAVEYCVENNISLENADLCMVNLSCCRLNYADLVETALYYTSLRGVDLRNANLRGAKLECADLTGAVLNEFTILDSCKGNAQYTIGDWMFLRDELIIQNILTARVEQEKILDFWHEWKPKIHKKRNAWVGVP